MWRVTETDIFLLCYMTPSKWKRLCERHGQNVLICTKRSKFNKKIYHNKLAHTMCLRGSGRNHSRMKRKERKKSSCTKREDKVEEINNANRSQITNNRDEIIYCSLLLNNLSDKSHLIYNTPKRRSKKKLHQQEIQGSSEIWHKQNKPSQYRLVRKVRKKRKKLLVRIFHPRWDFTKHDKHKP